MTAEPTGPDLARQALASWKAAAKTRPATKATKPRKKRAQYGDGRDPNPISEVLERLAVAYNWRRPSAAGQIMARWQQVAPKHHQLGSPERFDEETRTLHLRPVSDAAATKLRWEARTLAAALNDQVGADTVDTIKVLTVGATKATGPAAAEVTEREETAASPDRTPAEPSVGYREALEAHRANAVTSHGDPQLIAAIAAAANRAPLLRERPEDFTDAEAFREDLEERAAASRDSRARALQIARGQKACRASGLPTAFQRTA